MLYLVIGYMWLFIHRPFEVWPVLGTIRLELAYMLLLGLVWLFHGRKKWLPNTLHAAILAFSCAMVVCWLASPWAGIDQCSLMVENYLKLVVFYVVLVTVVQDEAGLKLLVKAFVVVMAIYMLHSLWEFHNGRHMWRMGITRLTGVDETMCDPNTFGASVLYALPMALLFWGTNGEDGRRARRTKFLVAGFVGMAAVCIVLTGSRSAFLGLVVAAVVLGWKSRWGKKIKIAALVLSPLLWFAIPADLEMRFATIVDPELGPKNAQASAQGRIDGLFMGLDLWQAYPATGCGPGAWTFATGSDVQSHTLYGQLPGELGTLGVLAFAAILLTMRSNMRSIKTAYKNHPEWGDDFPARLSKAIGLCVVLMLIEGCFGHNLYRFTWLWYGAFLIIARHVVAVRAEQAELVSLPDVEATEGVLGEQHAWTGMQV